MYEDHILSTLQAAQRPLSIAEVRETLARKLGGKVSYETTKKDLITLSAKGLIHSKTIGKGKRVTWIFWASTQGQPTAQPLTKTADPFSISIAQRDSMTPKQLATLYDRVIEEHADLIKDQLRKGSRYLVLCDRKVLYASNHEPSDEEVRNLEKKLGKVCYVVTEDPIEESKWSPIRNGDYYPTIEVFIGNAQWKEEEVFQRGLKIASDFDTGNPDIAAFSSEDLNLIQPTGTRFVRRAFHLGKTYDDYLTTLKLGVKDAKNAKRCIQKACRSVGRDLMFTFPLSILLSGKNKQSKVLIE